VTIVEARTDIEKHNRANQAVARVMKQSQFTGKSVIRAVEGSTSRQGSTTSTCHLEVDLSLTINILLPKFLLLPPGFNMIGSAFVGWTGQSRTKQLLEDLRDAYQESIKYGRPRIARHAHNESRHSSLYRYASNGGLAWIQRVICTSR
jgi:hypothetical protein